MAQHKLNVATVKSLDKPGRYGDGAGLYLIVDPLKAGNLTPTKRWSFRYMRAGKARETGLGGLTSVSLADARKKAQEIRELIAAGKDPVVENQRDRAIRVGKDDTFGTLALAYIKSRKDEWRNEKHGAQWTSTLETYCKHIWDMRAAEITPDDVVIVLSPIWQAKPETARRVRGRIEIVLDYARTKKFTDPHHRNAAQYRGNIDMLMAKQVKKPSHHAALPYDDIPQFMAQLRLQEGVGARALEFAILTAARSGEVRGAQWSEIDFEKKLWSIPGERMKADKDHVVPLTARAIDILHEMKRLSVDDFVFFGMKKHKGLSDMSLTAVLKRMNATVPVREGGKEIQKVVTAHGFRSTFRDWTFETTTHDHVVAEMSLAHSVGTKVEKAYRRGDALDKRRALMLDWAEYCARDCAVEEKRPSAADWLSDAAE